MNLREELVALVRKIQAAEGSEQEMDAWIDELQSRVPHPAVTDLICYGDHEWSAEDIVERALAYRPISAGC
jgi:hypothetical protein